MSKDTKSKKVQVNSILCAWEIFMTIICFPIILINTISISLIVRVIRLTYTVNQRIWKKFCDDELAKAYDQFYRSTTRSNYLMVCNEMVRASIGEEKEATK